MKTPDSPVEHDAPNVARRPTHTDRKWTTPDAPARGLIADDPKQATRYLDALLERDKLTPLSAVGQSYRELDRHGDAHIGAHYSVIGERFESLAIRRLGKLNPSFSAWDRDLPRQIKQAARDSVHMARFDRGSSERLPLKAGQKPREKTSQIFYLHKGAELQDTTGARTITGEAIHATRAESKRAAREHECEVWEGVRVLMTLCASVAVTGVQAIADAIKRLAPSPEILGSVYRALGHSNRRKLAKLLK